MLNVHVGDVDDLTWYIDSKFKIWFDTKNLLTDFSKRIIKEIDKSDVIGEHNILSPVLGSISPDFLSGGTKTLLLIKYNKIITTLNFLGENCYQYLVDIAKEQDVTICVDGVNDLFNDTNVDKIRIVNTGEIVTDKMTYMLRIMDLEDKVE
jgi:hypothetical protein